MPRPVEELNFVIQTIGKLTPEVRDRIWNNPYTIERKAELRAELDRIDLLHANQLAAARKETTVVNDKKRNSEKQGRQARSASRRIKAPLVAKS